MVDKSYT